jgi:hypothetical protein
MKFILIVALLAVSILSFATLYEVNFLDYSNPIPYSQNSRITFKDFKGYKKPAETLHGIQEFAFIKTSRVLKLKPNNTFSAITYFHPSRSYVFNQHLRNSDLLSHELYHFHIAEYITRLLKRDIIQNNPKLSATIIKNLKEKYRDLENEMQIQYDDETDHSYAFKHQKLWQHKIDSGLNSLLSFENSDIKLKN